MQKDDDRDAGPPTWPGSPSDGYYDAFPSEFSPSAILRDKLAIWRLDLSSIEFVKGAPKFRGSNSTVSRAFLVSPSSQDRATQLNLTKKDGLDLPGPPGGASQQRKNIAVKKMTMSGDPTRTLALALREANFLLGLSHKNVIKLEGFVADLSKDVVWLVFPWAEHGNLRDFIASAELEIPGRIWLIYDVAEGVEYLHGQPTPIRHGDLKCINILVNSECRAVITDFGSARHVATEDLGEETSHAETKPPPVLLLETPFSDTMTLTLKSVNFTLRWAAPELLHKQRATLASDIWALGMLIYEVMTNSLPFQDDAVNIAITRITTGDLPSMTNESRMPLIEAVRSLTTACWSLNPRKRPTAEDCRKSIRWMSMVRLSPIWTADAAATQARSPALTQSQSPALLMKLGDMYRRQCDYINASGYFTKALGCYIELSDSKGRAAALAELARVHRLRNEYSQAVTLYSEALQICTDIGDRRGRAYMLWSLAEVHRVQNEYSHAVTFYSEALQIWTDIGDRKERAFALSGLAAVHQARNEYNQAITFYTEDLQIRTAIGDRQGRADAFFGLAEVHRARNENSRAVTFYSSALKIRADIGDRRGRAYALQGLGQVHQAQNEYNQAITFYSEALQIFTDIGDRYGRAINLRSLALVHRSQKEYSQAVTLFSEAVEICTDIGDRSGWAYSLLGLADAHRDRGDYRDAIGPYTEAAGVFERIGQSQNATYASQQAAELRRRPMPEEAT